MKARVLRVVLVLAAVLCAAGAVWTATRPKIRGDTKCGPIFSQGNSRRQVCDSFYASHYLRTGILVGGGLAAYGGSSIIEPIDDRRSGRRRIL